MSAVKMCGGKDKGVAGKTNEWQIARLVLLVVFSGGGGGGGGGGGMEDASLQKRNASTKSDMSFLNNKLFQNPNLGP